jgi:hypothetical protein
VRVRPYYDDGTVQILHGDCRELLPELTADAIVTDPPYGLAFMGKAWDQVDQGFHQAWAAAAFQALPPGGWLLAFGGTRTWHRLACGIEEAGFEIRDTLMWLYGSGFPKSKACLKPGWEPILLARKPGSSVLQIDTCRVGHADDLSRYDRSPTSGMGYGGVAAPTLTPAHPAGRWPANVVLDPEAADLLDQQSGERPGSKPGTTYKTPRRPNEIYNGGGWHDGVENQAAFGYGDTGGASRFFYTAKAGPAERVTVDGEKHPTVKPLALMRWLVRLVTPPGGTVLDPFCGSGSTLVAAALEGRRAVGIEAEERWCKGSAKRCRERPAVQEAMAL